MKKKIISFFIKLVFIAAAASGLLFIGWLQFAVPVGKIGIMVSKSGGYYKQPVCHGEFLWCWEKLIPGNVKIYIFDISPIVIDYQTSGVLPNAEKYAEFSPELKDFSWNCAVKISAVLPPQALRDTAASNNITSQEEINAYVNNEIMQKIQEAVNHFINDCIKDGGTEYYHTQAAEKIGKYLKESIKSKIIIQSLIVQDSLKLPDYAAYCAARDIYSAYEKKKTEKLAEAALKNAELSVSEQLQRNRLAYWGEFLKKYPSIIELLAVSRNDAESALKALNEVRKQVPHENSN